MDNDCGSDRGVAGARSLPRPHVKAARRKSTDRKSL